MAREVFQKLRFSDDKMAVISKANAIIAEYQRQGFKLTLRQLYYQFVARDMIKNELKEYKKLVAVISRARLAGLLDWGAIEDRLRVLNTHASWGDPSDIIYSAAMSYKEDLWAYQSTHVEVWIEKDALTGIIEPICDEWRVPYFACRGNTSQSAQYEAGKRFREKMDSGKTVVVLHLGDHDPSGIDMTRDNEDRLRMFARGPVEVRRIALNFDQIKKFQPPPNPVKDTDSRAPAYVRRFGRKSWELDALDPPVLHRLIQSELEAIIQKKAWTLAKARERHNRDLLHRVNSRWSDVEEFLTEN